MVFAQTRLRAAIATLAVMSLVLARVAGLDAAEIGLSTKDPNAVKAGYLSSFARYVTWPTNTLAGRDGSWHIGVLESDPLVAILEKTVKRLEMVPHEDPTNERRAFMVHSGRTLEEMPPCHMLFIGFKDADKRRALLERLSKTPVLTIGDADGFLKEGGIIRFRIVKDALRIEVNNDQARSSGLTLNSGMLGAACLVIDKGIVRQQSVDSPSKQ